MAHNTGRAGRDLPLESDELWISAKSQDTFTPAGPWIVTDLTGLTDGDLEIGIKQNGVQLKTASSADLGWKVEEILAYLTSFMTLHRVIWSSRDFRPSVRQSFPATRSAATSPESAS